MLQWVGTLYAAIYLWFAIIIVVILMGDKDMPEGGGLATVFAAILLGLATVLLTGCEPNYEYELPQAGTPPVFDWQASAAVDAYRAPDVRVVE